MNSNALQGFTRAEIIRVFDRLGIEPPSKQQFYYWAQTGLITVEMANKKEPRYSFQTVLDLIVIQRLLKGGVTLQRIRKALDWLAREYNWGNLSEKPCLQEYQLITDGKDIYRVTDTSTIMSLLSEPRQLGWHAVVFPAEEIVRKSVSVITSLPDWRERIREEERKAYQEYWLESQAV